MLRRQSVCRPPRASWLWLLRDKAALVPFLLKGVADAPDSLLLFQADRIHPLEAAHPTLLANVWPELKRLLK